jgi:hypothetical protein
MKKIGLILLLFVSLTLAAAPVPRVTFDPAGTALVNGKPFFPVGIFSYGLDNSVMAEIKKRNFNTIVVAADTHHPDQLDWIQKEGMMAICPPRPDWIEPARQHPATLAWYLDDEPEGHGNSPEKLRAQYLKLKAQDPNHPIGIDHFLFDSLVQYKDATDVTMTSYYPLITSNAPPLVNFTHFQEKVRAIHGKDFPHWPFIQIFGGPDCEAGQWKQPNPAEARALVYMALAHRAQGILYFSYWPKAVATWESVGVLNKEIQRMTPWLVASGQELPTQPTRGEVHVRIKKIGDSGIVLVINTTGQPVQTDIPTPQLQGLQLRGLFDDHKFKITQGRFTEKLAPLASRAYVWGADLNAVRRTK